MWEREDIKHHVSSTIQICAFKGFFISRILFDSSSSMTFPKKKAKQRERVPPSPSPSESLQARNLPSCRATWSSTMPYPIRSSTCRSWGEQKYILERSVKGEGGEGCVQIRACVRARIGCRKRNSLSLLFYARCIEEMIE